MSSLGEVFPKEQERVRKLLSQYREIGPAGSFGAMMIEQVLREADVAAIGGDALQILKAYEKLKGCS